MWSLLVLVYTLNSTSVSVINSEFKYKTKQECESTLSVIKKDLEKDTVKIKGSCVYSNY